MNGRPLLDTRADARYFVDRRNEVDTALTAIRQELNILILGQRGVGKTSVLRRVAYELREARTHRVEVVDGALTPEPLDLLTLVAERLVGPALVRVPTEKSIVLRPWDEHLGRREFRPSPAHTLLSVIDRLRHELPSELDQPDVDKRGPRWKPGAPVVVFLDAPSVAAAQLLFGQLRDELWALPVVWVVTGRDEYRAEYLRGAADAFFEQRIVLEPLPDDAASELVARRLDLPGPTPAVERIVAMTDRTPRALVTAAREHGGGGFTAKSVAAAETRRSAARARLFELGRSAAMLVAEMQARGGFASASDDDLLRSLGWSRVRAAQVMRELEEAGLVTSSLQRVAGPGRPRKVYELIEPVL